MKINKQTKLMNERTNEVLFCAKSGGREMKQNKALKYIYKNNTLVDTNFIILFRNREIIRILGWLDLFFKIYNQQVVKIVYVLNKTK